MMPSPLNLQNCPTCGAKIKAGAPCTRCLLAAGLNQISTPPGHSIHSTDQSIDEGHRMTRILPHVAGTVSTTLGSRIPENFGDYELIEEIAHGAMGVVYLARQVSLDRFVALKFLLKGLFSSDELRERFRREAKAAAGLRHPNIVAVHHVGRLVSNDDDGLRSEQPYYCMDFIEGRSLAEVLRGGTLPPLKAANYCRTIAEAVHYAHERWVLHRDLKPSNILIDLNDVPHITDFGLAGKMEVRTELTATGLMIGTPSYLSPEMAAGRNNEVSAASDIYAIGAILYECLVGRPPFLGETLQETLLQIRSEDAVAPALINPTVPRDLDTICLKCLEKNPAHRYSTAQALADDLGCWLDHKPIQARPATMMTQVGKWMKRSPKLGLISGGILASLLTIGTLVVLNNHRMQSLLKGSQQQLMQIQKQTAIAAATEKDFATATLWFDHAGVQASSGNGSSPTLRNLWFGPSLATLAFSEDGRYLHGVSEGDAKPQFFDIASGSAVNSPLHHVELSPAKHRSQVHPDGQRLIIYSGADEVPTVVLRDSSAIRAVAISRNGRYLASTNSVGITRLWELNAQSSQIPSLSEAILSIGHTITPEGTLQPLSRDEIQQRWEEFSKTPK